MAVVYRSAITITRKQPYIDWANSMDDDLPELTGELADDRRTVYLVGELEDRPELSELLDEHWQEIFEEELAMWMDEESDWPAPRTREMFDLWFDAAITDTVVDLVPDLPMTESDAELADLGEAFQFCAWCEVEIEEGQGRFARFKLADRERFAARAGLSVSLRIDEERRLLGVMTPEDSEEARNGDDLAFRACSSRCEKALRKIVPRVLRKLPAEL